jgi:hypothetical protein
MTPQSLTKTWTCPFALRWCNSASHSFCSRNSFRNSVLSALKSFMMICHMSAAAGFGVPTGASPGGASVGADVGGIGTVVGASGTGGSRPHACSNCSTADGSSFTDPRVALGGVSLGAVVDVDGAGDFCNKSPLSGIGTFIIITVPMYLG